jgi:OPA family glycerol-3-phosphate transporter-like MFS transporter
LLFFFVIDLIIVKDRPSQAGFEDFDTGDASSGGMEENLTTIGLFKKLFSNPAVLTIAFIEFCSGVLRNGIMHWYHIYINEMEKGADAHLYEGAKFFVENWGLLLCFAGIFGGFIAGFISDKLFQSRRGPSAVFMYGVMLIGIIVMIFVLRTNQVILGITMVMISLCVIGVHGILSGTATADFGGRKAAATAVGLVDGFVYLGTSLQSKVLGYLTPLNWNYWPLFLIPFSVIGLVLSIRIWTAMPNSTVKKHH